VKLTLVRMLVGLWGTVLHGAVAIGQVPAVPEPIVQSDEVIRIADDVVATVASEDVPAPTPAPATTTNADATGGTGTAQPMLAPGSFGANDFGSLVFGEMDGLSRGINFNEFPRDFTEGLYFERGRWGVKIGGFVKAVLLHDFRAIDSIEEFSPAQIPIGAPQRTNSRFSARQTRLTMDARWVSNAGDPLRILVEGDFFTQNDQLRLRHAYGEYRGFLVGQTWSTLTHRAALPNTLDMVGDVASVGRRQTQVRWTRSWAEDRWSFSASLEDPRTAVDDDLLLLGNPRTIGPDVIGRLRYSRDRFQIQLGGVNRRLGFQPTGREVLPFWGSGVNLTGYLDVSDKNRCYGGLLWGEGIGSYRDLPDLALTSPNSGRPLESISWYSGLSHHWSDRWTTNLTYSQGDVRNTAQQPDGSINRLQYLAVNLIFQPTPYTFVGSELLWGMRRNLDGAEQDASRVMFSFGFLLP
jgi:hypothetical protein